VLPLFLYVKEDLEGTILRSSSILLKWGSVPSCPVYPLVNLILVILSYAPSKPTLGFPVFSLSHLNVLSKSKITIGTLEDSFNKMMFIHMFMKISKHFVKWGSVRYRHLSQVDLTINLILLVYLSCLANSIFSIINHYLILYLVFVPYHLPCNTKTKRSTSPFWYTFLVIDLCVSCDPPVFSI
jgi:hypothetical protein